MSTLQIGLVLPDVLGTYGDDGNALVLRQRARMRGFDANIVRIHLGDPIPTSNPCGRRFVSAGWLRAKPP